MLPEPQKTEITNYLLAAATAWQNAHPDQWFFAADLIIDGNIAWENSPLAYLKEPPPKKNWGSAAMVATKHAANKLLGGKTSEDPIGEIVDALTAKQDDKEIANSNNLSPAQMLGILLQDTLTSNGFEMRKHDRNGCPTAQYRRRN